MNCPAFRLGALGFNENVVPIETFFDSRESEKRGAKMKLLIILTSSMFLSLGAVATECQFESVASGNTCTDNEFAVAIWNGNTELVEQKLRPNPKLISACPTSLSYSHEFVTPLIFASCHSVYSKRAELVSILLKNGAANQINCESSLVRMTALKCANAIEDQKVRQDVLKLLKAAGASR